MEPGSGTPNMYSLERTTFLADLDAIRTRVPTQRIGLVDSAEAVNRDSVFLTVDDGRISTFTCIAPELEKLGWRGHFFVTTDWIRHPGFLTPEQIRDCLLYTSDAADE